MVNSIKKTEEKTILETKVVGYECEICKKEYEYIVQAERCEWQCKQNLVYPCECCEWRTEYTPPQSNEWFGHGSLIRECLDCGKVESKTILHKDYIKLLTDMYESL